MSSLAAFENIIFRFCVKYLLAGSCDMDDMVWEEQGSQTKYSVVTDIDICSKSGAGAARGELNRQQTVV